VLRRLAAAALASPFLQAAALTAGGLVLFGMWKLFNELAFNGSRGDTSWSWVTMFWYALPGFEAGVLVGLLPAAASRGPRRVLVVLTRMVWAANAVNIALVWFLISRGGLF
jgi:hypothetical protein